MAPALVARVQSPAIAGLFLFFESEIARLQAACEALVTTGAPYLTPTYESGQPWHRH